MRILLSEGAGLTSRQVATRLDALGHEVWAAVPDRWCMARFTKHVHHLLPVPEFGRDPFGWLDRVLEAGAAQGIEVVFPTQEQVTVLSHQRARVTAAAMATAVPPFDALRRVQDKLHALETLQALDIPQPRTNVITALADCGTWSAFPAYVKAPVGTGSTGVIRVTDRAALVRAVQTFFGAGAAEDGGVLVQEPVDGVFVMAQCVFNAGELLGFHANQRVREGANGSASSKRSMDVPSLRGNLARLGHALAWHGALSVDAIWDGAQALVIDVNPRLVEPGNAMAAGVDMVSALLAVALERKATPTPAPVPDRRTHQLLMAVLGAAQRRGRRRDVACELRDGLLHRGVYTESSEELQPLRGDWRAAILPTVAALATLIRPRSSELFTDGAVQRYALHPEGWRALCADNALGDPRLRTAPLHPSTP